MKNTSTASLPAKNALPIVKIKEEILEYLSKTATRQPVPVNDLLKKFEVERLEQFIIIFSKLENDGLVQCNGNFGWLGSRQDGELLDLSHPLTQFTCQILPEGIEFVKKKNSSETDRRKVDVKNKTLAIAGDGDMLIYQVKQTMPWYQHWLFWLIAVAVFMFSMIALVEFSGY
jgi:hypothetical protein